MFAYGLEALYPTAQLLPKIRQVWSELTLDGWYHFPSNVEKLMTLDVRIVQTTSLIAQMDQ